MCLARRKEKRVVNDQKQIVRLVAVYGGMTLQILRGVISTAIVFGMYEVDPKVSNAQL